jgi:hypothetical protein
MPNFVRHEPITFEQLGSTISNCPSIEDAARRAFNNKRYDDPVAFLRETNGRTVVAFIRVQDDDGTLSIRKLESFFLGRKKGGRVPLDTVPDLFLMSARKIYRYFSTANLVVDSVISGQKTTELPKERLVESTAKKQTMAERPRKRVVRSDASKRLAYSSSVPSTNVPRRSYRILSGISSDKPYGSIGQLVGY